MKRRRSLTARLLAVSGPYARGVWIGTAAVLFLFALLGYQLSPWQSFLLFCFSGAVLFIPRVCGKLVLRQLPPPTEFLGRRERHSEEDELGELDVMKNISREVAWRQGWPPTLFGLDREQGEVKRFATRTQRREKDGTNSVSNDDGKG